jgi:polyisoprenyl-teichoic acid--peptidoglycan teichoic acid transferase
MGRSVLLDERGPSGSRDVGARPGKRPPRGFRRASSVKVALAVTLLGAALPGAGYLWTRRRLGYAVLLPSLGAVAVLVVYVQDLRSLLDIAFDPTRLRTVAVMTSAGFAVWAFTVVTTFLMARPVGTRPLHTRLGVAAACLLCVAVALPVAQAVQTARTQADLVAHVFENNRSATAPSDATQEDPWGGRQRVSVLLLGGDGAVGRDGMRTDTMILLSADTQTGKAVMFSLPRNMMNAQFPEDSPLHDVFPEGFTGDGDPGAWMLNAVYGQVPIMHPGLLGTSDNEGADALKQAVEGSLGTTVDYYVLVNLLGFQQIVDAMGGVTVNINEPVAINGNTDRGIPPTGYLEPGPDQHLNGYQALWYTRGRWGSDDYERMLRQRCMIDALVDEANPFNLLRRYQALARAGQDIVRTDIPRHLLPAFVNLGLKMKDQKLRSIAFVSSDQFFSGDPDFAWMQSVVDRALGPRKHRGGDGPEDPGKAVRVSDACGYHPVADASAP